MVCIYCTARTEVNVIMSYMSSEHVYNMHGSVMICMVYILYVTV